MTNTNNFYSLIFFFHSGGGGGGGGGVIDLVELRDGKIEIMSVGERRECVARR